MKCRSSVGLKTGISVVKRAAPMTIGRVAIAVTELKEVIVVWNEVAKYRLHNVQNGLIEDMSTNFVEIDHKVILLAMRCY